MSPVDLLSLATQPIRPFESIPVMSSGASDISGLSGDTDSRAQVASAIREACIHVGFFYVKNHGVDEAVIKSTVGAARRFFDLSLEEKMKLDVHKSPNFKGYTPLLGENTNPENRGDLHECFDIGPEIDASTNSSMSGSNVWPPEDLIPGFQEAVLKYYYEVRTSTLEMTQTNPFLQCFTILWQDENPALQVLNTSGQWIDAKPMPGTFVINIADQLSRWT
ncbi:hypothetical protein FRC11_000206, partial [Ceratobasidium sp. 423]